MTPKILLKILKLKAKNIKIGQKIVGHQTPFYFIAEAGVNHNGRLDLALKMIEVAKKAGADAVKFQTFKANQVCLPHSPTPLYQKKQTKIKNQIQLLKSVALKENDYPHLIKKAKALKIDFLSTPHGHLDSAKFLLKFNLPAFKVGSGDITNLPLLAFLAKQKKPLLLSTGTATLKEIKEAVAIIEKNGGKVVVLHCNTNYPTPPNEANLAAILDLYLHFPNKLVGYSDHTLIPESCLSALSFGARVIEVHFTLDKNLPGPDQKASYNPKELSQLIKKLRLTEKILGEGFKKPTKSELKMAPIVRKSIVTLKPLKKNQIITKEMIGIKRPAKNGLAPKFWFKIIGKKASRNIPTNTQLQKGDWR